MRCQQGHWTRKGFELEGPTSIGEGNECQAESRRGWTQGGVRTRTLDPKGSRHKAVCQQRHWTLKGGGLEGQH